MIGFPTRHRLMGLSRPIPRTRGLLEAHNSFLAATKAHFQEPNFEGSISKVQPWKPNLDVFNTLSRH
jgi:hypothetical protein